MHMAGAKNSLNYYLLTPMNHLSLLDMKPIAFIWMHQEVAREQPHCQIWLHIGLTKEWPTSKGC
tara:strand:- start:329 stop:520 length:192 start_codon:yes stop_codon:yes gene_type:complete